MNNPFKRGDIVTGNILGKTQYPELSKQWIVEVIISSSSIRLIDNPTNWHTSWFELVNTKGIKYDSNKLRYSLLPWIAIKEVVKVLEFGAKKYSVNNWQKIEPQRYKDAAMRHLVAIFDGEWLDEESQLPHAAHCICCLLFLLWFKQNE